MVGIDNTDLRDWGNGDPFFNNMLKQTDPELVLEVQAK